MGKEQNIDEIIKGLMSKEDRKDAEFRLALLTSEIGDIAKYITHDPKLNPNARPHGTIEGEKLAYGEVIVMLMSLAYARGIDYNQALKQGLKNWMEADWRKREAKANLQGVIEGTVIKEGYAQAKAYVVSREHPIRAVKKEKDKPIIVLAHADPDIIIYLEHAAGFVTDHGGKTCHLAVLTLDEVISKHVPPSIIGTGNATKVIKHGEMITLEAYALHGKGYVKKER
jgi:phosphohistidine swiveling domain-containing protein